MRGRGDLRASPRAGAALGTIALLAACGAAPLPAAAAGVSMPPEYRALWVDAFHEGMHSQQEIDQLVDTAHRATVNALFVQVRKDADSYYLDSLEPMAADSGPPGFDPLAYLLRRAHTERPRIEVHAWVNTFYVGTGSPLFFYLGGDWGNRSYTGDTGGYLDPGDPDVRAYTHLVLMHLAERYDLDGLHLDFVRYPGADWGYSPAAVQAFDDATGRAGVPGPADPVWQQWRRDQVTAFVRDLHDDLAGRRPGLKLSAAAVPWGWGPASEADWARTSAYREVYQDWDGWLRAGILDLAVAMNYDTAWNPDAALWFEQWLEFEKDNQHGRSVVIGVGAYFNYPEDTLAQVRLALAPSASGNRAAGVAIYSYASTSLYGTSDYYDDSDAAAALPRQPYAAGLDAAGLRLRAEQFNDAFWDLLTARGSYTDPVAGSIPTRPVFTGRPAVPTLPWKR
jgi:uncharacterized lipoprotein YddW (UPF0748 family)